VGFDLSQIGSGEVDRLSWQAMAVIRAVLDARGCLVDEDEPDLPDWPPPGLSSERAEALHAGALGSLAEKAILERWRAERDAVLAAPTRTAGRIARRKLERNEGWIVTSGECQTIARVLRETTIDAALVDQVEEAQAASDRVMREACAQAGHVWIGGATPLTVADLVELLGRFADWNARAGADRGYRVD